MDIPGSIDGIIEARKGRRQWIAQKRDFVLAARGAVEGFRAFRGELKDGAADDAELLARLDSVVTAEFDTRCAKALAALDRLDRRFARDRVHISFVGRAGQGKSLVMQRISGLGSDVIPSADGSDCTGAKSMITNDDAQGVSADITFFSEAEAVGIVNKYLDSVFHGAEAPIRSAREIAPLASRRLGDKVGYTDAEAMSRMKHLNAYIEHIDEFIDRLGRTENVPGHRIEEYVAQYSAADKNRKFWKYLGVKEANILCRFPHGQCGKIVLVDTIGLGATSLGVEDEMMKAVRDDSDAVIYMKRPDPNRPRLDNEDYRIIEMIKEGVSADYTREMLFWVFNRVESGKGKNSEQIATLTAEIDDAVKAGKLPVAAALEVNCFDSADVEEHLLRPVLERMASRLPVIDGLLIAQANDALSELYEAYSALAARMAKSFSMPVSRDVKRAFEGPANELFNKWFGQLRDYCGELAGSDVANAAYRESVAKTVRETQRVPGEETIAKMLSATGGMSSSEVSDRIKNYMRLRIIDNFLDLDEPLGDIVRDFKSRVVAIMAGPDGGRLGGVVPADTDDPDRWLDSFIGVLEGDEEFAVIVKAVRELKDIRLTVKSYMMFGVCESVKPLDSNVSNTEPLSLTGNDAALHSKLIHQYLSRQAAKAHTEMRKWGDKFLRYPNEALYAAAKQFYERITYSGIALDATGYDIKRAWEHFYVDNIPLVWKEESAKSESQRALAARWAAVADEIKRLNQRELFLVSAGQGGVYK